MPLYAFGVCQRCSWFSSGLCVLLVYYTASFACVSSLACRGRVSLHVVSARVLLSSFHTQSLRGAPVLGQRWTAASGRVAVRVSELYTCGGVCSQVLQLSSRGGVALAANGNKALDK
jgi:hypothetical protein